MRDFDIFRWYLQVGGRGTSLAIEFGKYIIEARLGGGGMAEVFRAVLSGPGGFEKHLALKLILPQFSDDEEFVSMFIHEATLAAALDHANIVRIHEFDQVEGRYYIAMELVDGKDLRAVLARSRKIGRPLNVGEAVLLSMEISRGLSFAHGELTPGAPVVIHRDISPHNVILSRAGEVKITDFGIAKLSSAASFTRTGVVKGKLAYMSPEQASGAKLDKRSDLFSLGCVMWELLTGQRLFRAANDMDALNKLKHAPILPPSTHKPDIPPELDQLVLACLVRDREKRLGSASEICNSLDVVLRDLVLNDRATALSGLFRELFGAAKARKATAVMDMVDLASSMDDSRGARQGQKDLGNGKPGAMDQSSEEDEVVGPKMVEPVGPEVETALDSAIIDSNEQKAKRESRKKGIGSAAVVAPGRWKKWQLGVGLVISLLVLGLGFSLVKFARENREENREGGISEENRDGGISGEATGATGDGGISGGLVGRGGDGQKEEVLDIHGKKSGDDGGEDGDGEDGDGGGHDMDRHDGDVRDAKHVNSPPVKKRSVGYLNLNAIPWAKVYKGRRFLGVTPVEHLPLVVGKHRLTLINRELGVKRSVLVVIKRGTCTTKVVNLR